MDQPSRRRREQPAKTVELPKLRIAARPKKGEIHIYGLGGRPITVGSNPHNKRGHPRLYAMLRDFLKRKDRWPPEMEERDKRK